MSVKEIAERVAADCDDGWGGRESTSLTAMRIEHAIREAARPLVEALERMLAARNIQERIAAPEAAKRALAAWREGK